MKNALNWFEIPAVDFARAKKFYETVLGAELHVEEMMGMKMGFLPSDREAVGGAIVAGDQHTPSMDGVVIYLNGNPDLNGPLSRVEKAGGKVLMPKMKISDEIGHMAFFLDSEGNKVAFHSNA
jgi:hypothetical protein